MTRIRNGHDIPYFGREELIETLLSDATKNKCVMLFGGRGAGKTTVLRNVENWSKEQFSPQEDLLDKTVAIYVDLQGGLRPGSGPSDFYALLLRRLAEVLSELSQQEESLSISSQTPPSSDLVETFTANLENLLKQFDSSLRHIVFLLDEPARTLKDFPRGFQDNLFSLLYGDAPNEIQKKLAFVFTGGQDLAAFCEDETSPLGSRALLKELCNLELGPFLGAVKASMHLASIDENWGEYIFEETGGHPAVGRRFIDKCTEVQAVSLDKAKEVAGDVADELRPLFENWMKNFSDGAKLVLGALNRKKLLERPDLTATLQSAGGHLSVVSQVWKELQYVGVCRLQAEHLVKCNELFWRYYSSISPSGGGIGPHNSAISSVEQKIRTLLKEEESQRLEFKSTGRKNTRSGKKDPEIEWAIVKTIAAFANSEGGTLLIGVDDNKDIVGINQDYQFLGNRSQDGWGLWLTTLVREKISDLALTLLTTQFCDLGDLTVALIEVKQSTTALYATKNKGQPQDFFVRTANSTISMQMGDAHKYINERFRGNP